MAPGDLRHAPSRVHLAAMTALPSAPAALRNREPIRDVLAQWLPERGRVLELAAGTGEHAVFLARAFQGLDWLPTDLDEATVRAIEARGAEGPPNLREPQRLDATDPATWPDGPFDALVCINMIHISPWAATEGLMALAGERLTGGGLLYLYGPYRETDRPFAASNQAFDESLRARNPSWGVRRLDDVATLAGAAGLRLTERIEMPANNLSLLFRRDGPAPRRGSSEVG